MAHYSIAEESPAASNIILYFQDIAYLIQALSYPNRHQEIIIIYQAAGEGIAQKK